MKKLLVHIAIAASCALPAAASPSSGEAVADTVMTLDEVSVTALKQGARLNALPVSSTEVGRRQIERLNIVTMKGASALAPNFYIPDYGSRITSSIYVRGLGARIDQPVVGLNVDNVPFLNKDAYDFDVLDIERIELLRGPQSTLYGRNTMGGLVNIYTLSPMNYQGVRAMAEMSAPLGVRAGASVYRRPAHGLAWSASVYGGWNRGFFTNRHNGRPADSDRSLGVRSRLVWTLSDRLTVENVLSASITRQGGYPYEYLATGEINYNDTCFYRRTVVTDGITARFVLPSGTILSSITSVQYINDNMTLDQDFLPLPYFTLTQAQKEWAVTHDMVARGRKGGYEWLGGLFAFYKRKHMDAPVTFLQDGIDNLVTYHRNLYNPEYPIRWDSDRFRLGSTFRNPVWGAALYHQSSLTLGGWKLDLGLRLDVESTTLRYRSRCSTSYTVYNATVEPMQFYANRPIDIDDAGRLHRTFVEFLPRLAATYSWAEGCNAYASVARGYKAGGFNTQMFSDLLQQRLMGFMGIAEQYSADEVVTYRPEYSINYELGAHLADASGRLSGQAALFYIDCRNQQLTVFPDGTTTGRIMANAGRTRSMGAELSGRWTPGRGWRMDVSYGYTDATFRSYHNGMTSMRGKHIPYAPSHTLFAGATYTHRLGGAEGAVFDRLVVNVNCRGTGPIQWDDLNTVGQPFYALLGASATLEGPHWSVTAWGENITDTQYSTFYFVSINNAFAQRGRPARGGITVRFSI